MRGGPRASLTVEASGNFPQTTLLSQCSTLHALQMDYMGDSKKIIFHVLNI